MAPADRAALLQAAPAGLEYDSAMTTKRPRRLIAAAVLLVALLGTALAVLLRPDAAPGGPAPQPVTPASSAATTAPSTAAAALPPLTAAPTGVQWELFQGVALPTSTTDGPTRVDRAVHAGFSRTPTGALLADAQISVRSLATPDLGGLREVIQQQLVEGPGKTAYLNLIAGLTENEPPPGGFTQYVGFRYITYTPDLAVISLATRGSSGRIQVGTDTMRWVDGDWKLELPASGLQQPQVVPDIAGYVPWRGVS